MSDATFMQMEIEEIPDALKRILDSSENVIKATSDEISQLNPNYIGTVARGISDHAAYYLKYAFELLLGKPVVSLGPSIISVYDVHLDLRDYLTIGISQSGESPDIYSL